MNTFFFSYCPLLQHLCSPPFWTLCFSPCLFKLSLLWLVTSHRPEQVSPTDVVTACGSPDGSFKDFSKLFLVNFDQFVNPWPVGRAYIQMSYPEPLWDWTIGPNDYANVKKTNNKKTFLPFFSKNKKCCNSATLGLRGLKPEKLLQF